MALTKEQVQALQEAQRVEENKPYELTEEESDFLDGLERYVDRSLVAGKEDIHIAKNTYTKRKEIFDALLARYMSQTNWNLSYTELEPQDELNRGGYMLHFRDHKEE